MNTIKLIFWILATLFAGIAIMSGGLDLLGEVTVKGLTRNGFQWVADISFIVTGIISAFMALKEIQKL